ncbi:MAG: acyl-CoA thioesterase [Cyclobacteriaceae bacterium]
MDTTFKHASESQVVISELMLPSHSNFSGKIHGGYILSLMDQVAFACAAKYSGQYCVTASVNTVDFINPIEIGELVTLKASVNWVGNSSMVVGIRVESEDITTGEKKHCNSSYFTMVSKDENGKNVAVPGLVLRTDDDIRRFSKSIRRKEMQSTRRKEFTDTNFASKAYIDQLKNYKVKVEYQPAS